ncbi:MAG: FtsK/SpoIIIE domain-containing protein [Planctomycetota bacterium]
MDDRLFSSRLRAAWRELLALNADRDTTQTALDGDHETETAAATREHAEAIAAADAHHEAESRSSRQEHDAQVRRIETHFSTATRRTQQAFEQELKTIDEKAAQREADASRKLNEAIWLAETLYEAKEGEPQRIHDERLEQLTGRLKTLESAQDDGRALLRRLHQPVPASWPTATAGPVIADDETSDDDPDAALESNLAEAGSIIEGMPRMSIPRLFLGNRPLVLVVLLLALGGALAGWRTNWQWTGQWLVIGPGAVLGAGLVALGILYAVARSQVAAVSERLAGRLVAARSAHARAVRAAEDDRERQETDLIESRDREIAQAKRRYEPVGEQVQERRQKHLDRINERYPARLKRLEEQRQEQLREAESAFREQMEEIERHHREARAEADATRHRRLEASRTTHDLGWTRLVERWSTSSRDIQAVFTEVIDRSAALFPGWEDPSWTDWSPPSDFAPAIRFGELAVDVAELPGGLSTHDRLPMPWPARFTLPAVLAFPDRCSMLIEHGGEGAEPAVETLQTVMFRLATALPPGKVRFTIIDPVGLGQNFAGFMHLTDYLEQLVTDRIWTEVRHIEQRLADLTDHMENVIQKYLRNEYATIAEYNEHAGEIAEPYRFLVIANFPVNFSDTAAKRLASIVSSGPRCGVYTLIGADTRQKAPRTIDVADLRRPSVHLVQRDDRFAWKDEDFEALPLALDPPPPAEFLIEQLHRVGAAARDSSRVEVPFTMVAPRDEDAWWSADAGPELRVPLGRTGATSLQSLELGRGTSQHVLIAGKTGSGKSTLLHVLVTNLALWFRPDEVELYLVDFKKGVEFKPYATHALPHARAVAIESDREFGLSVLQRLDGELKRRGDAFRKLGVQDLPGYRAAADAPMPRTLLIIDEFQEFFTEDDKIAQEAALLLDRLVRQGRAFGIHVILGSQTLGGAYGLAKSTMGQMAVRIALQCSETDSYLIMSEDNSAARLLARPGEAIYNDESGRVEGNSPFQIVWLADDLKADLLARVAERARREGFVPPAPQIVFEGAVPADVRRNHHLEGALDAPPPSEPLPAVPAWLGEAVAIKDPTAAVFRRQTGHNLLLVGQRDEAALAIMSIAMVSLAAAQPPLPEGGAALHVLDGTSADSPFAGLADRVIAALPVPARRIGRRDLPEVMAALAEEVDRRQQADAMREPPIYLVVLGLQRFRDLRQSDSFGFSLGEDDKPPSPDKLFLQVLRDGPLVGVHTLVWCDSANSVDRTFDRQTLREFDMRVVFQMSAADSTNLIDSPQANRIGLHHAIFYSEERGICEKFRPYGLPAPEWFTAAGKRLAGRTDQPVG